MRAFIRPPGAGSFKAAGRVASRVAATFDDLGLSEASLEAVRAAGYEEPTPVQIAAIPLLLGGSDVLMEAPTGTGKTAAYALPLLERSEGEWSALVLAPTRELAKQIADEVKRLGGRAAVLTGGVKAGGPEDSFHGATVLVATPGRLLDYAGRGLVDLSRARFVVLDEVDRMLDQGFLPEVDKVLALTTSREQTACVSATLPRAVRELAERVLRKPDLVRAAGVVAEGEVKHYRLNVLVGAKTEALHAVLTRETFERALVFVRTRANVDRLAREMKARGLRVDVLHGERGAFERRHVMDLFRKGESRIVLATDVASRGLDVPEVDFIVNFDLPDERSAFLHRSGRTGRMGRAGRVITFVEPSEKEERIALEKLVGQEFVPFPMDVATRAPRASERWTPAKPREVRPAADPGEEDP